MRSTLALLLPLAVAACTGVIGGAGDDGVVGGDAGPGGAAAPRTVDGQIVVTPQVLRLTNLGYTNSVRDLFPGVVIPSLTLPAASNAVVYDNDAIVQAPTATLIQAYQANASAIAAAVVGNLGAVLPCAAASADDACALRYLSDLSSRAYRHVLRDDETARLTAAWQTLRAANDVPTSMGVVVEGILQSASFLYQIEEGTPVADKPQIARLTGSELAARLATFLWASVPDAPLRAVGDDDRLLQPEILDAQARRLLDDPRARDSVAHMQYQWLRFNLLEQVKKDTTMFPAWTDATGPALRDATVRFVDHVFWEEGTLSSLFTDTHTFVNDALAPLYGLPAVNGSGLTMVATNPAQRGGLLTQVGLLAAFGHETMESPVLRGVFVLDRILCTPPPPPPPNVKNTPPAPAQGDTSTTRQRFQTLHELGDCAGCHKLIDGVGFGFEHYDAVGAWRDAEGGKPVDATGTILGTQEIDGPFDGILDLNTKLATSDRVAKCITKNWLQYGLGIDPQAATDELVTPVRAGLSPAPTFKELLLLVVKSAAFRYRTVSP
jgi:Protein of unknown function (DUF1592)/Protein of unknown function (DUF1588)/Protein of unknown function (DUF1595)/Protein of unknown function (DUF1585)/Protein of unknown function (DUF1587)